MAQNKKKHKLKNLKIKKVDFVGEGANLDAYINFFKSKKEPVTKGTESFNDKIKEQAKYKVYDQIWQFINALQVSLIDIVRDDDIGDKAALMNKSLEEFYGAAGLAIEAWSNSKLSDYCVSDEEVSKETSDIFKGLFLDNAMDEVAEAIKKASEAYVSDDSKMKKFKKGDEDDMKVEDLDQSKLTEEEREQLNAIVQKARVLTNNEGEEPNKGDGEPVKKEKPVAEDGKDDIFKGMSPAAKEELLALRKFREEQENKEFISVAKKYEVIGKKAEELAPVLKSLKAAGGTDYETMIGMLDSAVETVNKSGAFNELGSNGHSSAGSSAIAKARIIADEIKKGNPNITEEQAMAKAWEENPDLMVEYDSEIGG